MNTFCEIRTCECLSFNIYFVRRLYFVGCCLLFRVWVLCFLDEGSGFRVQSLGVRVRGLRSGDRLDWKAAPCAPARNLTRANGRFEIR